MTNIPLTVLYNNNLNLFPQVIPTAGHIDSPPVINVIRCVVEGKETLYAGIDIVMWAKGIGYQDARNQFNYYKSIYRTSEREQGYGFFPKVRKFKARTSDGKLRLTDFIAETDINTLLQLLGKRKFRPSEGYIYLIRCQWIGYEDIFKIGIANEIESRVASISHGMPFPIEVIAVARSSIYKRLEKRLHSEFACQRVRYEWFQFSSEQVEVVKHIFEQNGTMVSL